MRSLIPLLAGLLTVAACTREPATPKPRGYYRIELPAIDYVDFTSPELPYAFAVSPRATVELPPVDADSAGLWLNLNYESLGAKVYCGYRTVTPEQLEQLEYECRELVRRSAERADSIIERRFENHNDGVYGTLFLIGGETPSPAQFMLTDSTRHFFRGALYYLCPANSDSLQPVTDCLRRDLAQLIHSFRWK